MLQHPVTVNLPTDAIEMGKILRNLPVAIYTCDRNGYITSYNESAAELWGRTPKLGKDKWCGSMKIYHKDGSEMLLDECPMAIALQRGEIAESIEIIVERPDGGRRNVIPHPQIIFDESGQITGAINTLIDITEVKESEGALIESEQRLRLALDAGKLGAWSVDLVTGEAITSQRHQEIMGYEEMTDLTRDKYLKYMHHDDRKTLDVKFYDAIKNGDLQHEARVLRPGKPVCWIKIDGKTIYNEKGEPVKMLGTILDITEQKKAFSALEENEHRLNIAIEAAELGTWELNLKTREGSYSKRYLEILGLTAEERPVHEELLNMIHPEDLALRNKAVETAMQNGIFDVEMRIIHKDRSIRWIKGRGKVFYDEQGNPERMLGTIMDTTEQKRALKDLQESEERFKMVANRAPVMIWMSGSDKFFDFFNASWLNFTGKTLEQESNEGWLEGVHPDDVERCQQVYNEAFEAKENFHVVYRLKRHDGQYRWISDNAVPRYSADGSFVGFISACMDVDDEKQFNQLLQDRELLFKTITNVAPVGLWMTNARGENNFVNDIWVKWTGLPLEEQYGIGWMRPVLEPDAEYTYNQYIQQSALREKFSAEFRFRKADGSISWGLSEGFPYYDNKGNFAGYAGSVSDITDRKKDEIRKNEFFAVASHELKTPITSIKAYAQLLAATYSKANDNFLKSGLSKIDNQVNKMTKLIADFLNLSKIESDKFQLNKEIFIVNELVNEVVSDIQLVTDTHHIILDNAVIAHVSADKEKIAQVLNNFLTNAIKYSPQQNEIKVQVTFDEHEVAVSVADKGIGINPEEHDKIFERFYRAGSNKIYFSGFGIGLYISAEIIKKHDGRIGVFSKEGEGSVFYFKLPIVEA